MQPYENKQPMMVIYIKFIDLVSVLQSNYNHDLLEIDEYTLNFFMLNVII